MIPTWLQPFWNFGGTHATSALNGMDLPALLALAAALGWASGLRLYAVVFSIGLAGVLGWLPLPAGLHLLQHRTTRALRLRRTARATHLGDVTLMRR